MKDEDIRDKVDIRDEDIRRLNFIRDAGRYVFRKHFRQGLRSRIMAVLDADDVVRETSGEMVDGIRVFPRARPRKMLRIFTKRFERSAHAHEEARTYKIIEAGLGNRHVATSSEFIVTYRRTGRGRPWEIVLCGLQEYVAGEILDPWGFFYEKHLEALCSSIQAKDGDPRGHSFENWVRNVRKSAEDLIVRLKEMILKTGFIPDLSGFGNLILTPEGDIKLVDINNVSRVVFDDVVRTDDRGYPVCDKSIEVMAVLEQQLLGRAVDMNALLYRHFLDTERTNQVKILEEKFYAAHSGGA
ncbi:MULTISPECIES: hypothetical protein [Desulfococcus]|uniref:Uncharacterized protein n=1 Tax=Desulfococcus multivorans DSM 2059 TaxID=1121405 RepID=S7VBL7_DESML|nr:hypothetical protein [Desulfococcus multivorans]AOY56843.1 conserved uncharacterized protein [Desulfococcus multivorans]AQU99385.1 hypothetical protein B2D07_00335 [Desulfococcus multivorans]EPR41858.1 hypothetical protein dsmv_1857 [Desulfococcus multivorans DSM 2059]MDX9817928.1 hypothetical protein [Desulfococcus multivorans]SJZ93177.1 hypothetical protein SAMN02745446_02135 [Desulfococcus multivorans DSM 2059]